MNDGLRPREIQARIRAGQDSAQIAAECGMPFEMVARFEAPVLAERAHVAERARRTEVRHSTPGLTVEDAVTDSLRARGIAPDSADWDSWRRDDGRWSVALEFGPDGDRHRAMFTYDLVARAVVPDDDEARALIDPAFEAPAPPPPRLVSLPTAPDEVYDHDRAERAIEAVTEVVVVSEVVRIEREAGVAPDAAVLHAVDSPVGTADSPDQDAGDPDVTPTPPAAPPPAPRARSKGKRASVPSWDEILFGGDEEG